MREGESIISADICAEVCADPFGASNMSPGLFSEAAYEAFVIDRVDYRLKV